MRLRFFTICTGLMAMIIFTLSGCSDDTTNSGSGGGGLSIVEDQAATQQEINAAADSTIMFLSDAFQSRTSPSSGGSIDPVYYTPIDNDSDVVVSTYDDNSGWHQVYVTRIATAYNSWWRDSIQFRNSDGNFQRQGNTASSMSYRHRFNRATLDTTSEYYNRAGVWGYEISGLQTNQATINGTTAISTQSKYQDASDSTVWRSYTYNATVSNLMVNRTSSNWNSACPTAGTINATVTTTYKRGGADMITHNWNVTIEFNNGNAHITLSIGRRDWETDRSVCTVVG